MPNTTIDKITDDITSLFKSAAEKIKNANATPIFSTICPMSLDTWNHRRPSQHHTSHLSSFPYYPLMQEKHESVILKINQEIHLLNKSHNMHTPRLAKSVIYHRKGQLRCWYGRLVDGVHPKHNLQNEWVLDLNRSPPNQLPPTEPAKSQPDDQEYDSDSSAKRSWLYWWCWLCVWMDGLSWHPTSVSASWPLSPDSGCWCLGQTLRMAPQSLTRNGWDWLNTLATLWCRERLVKAALLVGVLGSMSRAECVVCASRSNRSNRKSWSQIGR